jgi:predicted glycoside hydrolase/deacetylase ChbG (UPF0249 family)
MTSLLDRLGYRSDARVVIISGLGLGVSHAANMGVFSSLRIGAATSTGLMMPCPWARHAAARVTPSDDVGVELTLNAEHSQLRWGPLTQAPTLLDGDGGFPRTVDDVWDHADVDEVRRECLAQLERARQWGVDVTHLGSHLNTLLLRPEFFDVMPRHREQLFDALRGLQPGVTEIVLHPAVDSPELRAYTSDWTSQVEDHQLLVDDAQIGALLKDVPRISYRQLRLIQQGKDPD